MTSYITNEHYEKLKKNTLLFERDPYKELLDINIIVDINDDIIDVPAWLSEFISINNHRFKIKVDK